MKFYKLLNNKMYTLSSSYVKIYLKMTKLCCFSQDNLQFLSIPRVVLTGSLLVALKRAGLLVM